MKKKDDLALVVKQEYPFLYLARIAACIAVVAIHSVGLSPATLHHGPIAAWWAEHIVDSFVIWAVPLFVMISGAILLNRQIEQPNTFYKKRLWRVGLPILMWVPVYILFYHFIRGDSITVSALFNRFLHGQYDHLYFLFIYP